MGQSVGNHDEDICRIQTTLSWQKHWKNGQYPYSNQFFHVFTQSLKKLIDVSAYGVMEQGKQYTLRDTAIIYDDMIKMANLSIVG